MCYHDLRLNLSSDRAFMGATHALSGLAVLLGLVAFVPGFMEWAGLSSLALVILAALVVTGGSLLPDLDNSASSAKSALGIFGHALSFLFINSSRIIQTIVRTRRDDPDPNPHRGFWHTIPAALLIGVLTLLATQIPGKANVPLYGEVSISWLVALFITAVSAHLALAGLFNSAVKKIRKSSIVGELVAFVVSLGITAAIFWFVPHEGNFWWLAVAITLGVLVHIFGDAFTTAGVPLLFPLSGFIKGKFWWTTRFTPMKAGGTAEKFVVIPILSIVTLAAFVKIAVDIFSVAA